MGSTATETEELENTTFKYLIGEQTEKMWQRLKGMWVSSLLGSVFLSTSLIKKIFFEY